ncbi:hypothetical protein [Romboutsia lituseburensis]|uniref:hypothetical protein n=1 Tax=Romboutsia lituseburensis TaxID=1537 RepID=UPI0022EB5056|nr:hypothetical protein [Romboutsia lituseburensis]
MIIKKIDITSKMGLQLSMEEDLFIVKLYEDSLSGHKENVVYKCKVSDSSMEEMIDHINKTHKIIIKQQ